MHKYRFSFEPHELPTPLRDFSANVREPISENTLAAPLGPVVARSLTGKRHKNWSIAIHGDGTGTIHTGDKHDEEIHFKYGKEG